MVFGFLHVMVATVTSSVPDPPYFMHTPVSLCSPDGPTPPRPPISIDDISLRKVGGSLTISVKDIPFEEISVYIEDSRGIATKAPSVKVSESDTVPEQTVRVSLPDLESGIEETAFLVLHPSGFECAESEPAPIISYVF